MVSARQTLLIAVIGAMGVAVAGCGGGGSPAAQAPPSSPASTSATGATTAAPPVVAPGTGRGIHGSWLHTVPGIATDPSLYSGDTSTGWKVEHRLGGHWVTAQGGPAPDPPDRLAQVEVVVSRASDGTALVQVLGEYPA